MNAYAAALGSIGTAVGLVRAVPQLVRLLRAREAYGVSLDTAATSSIVSFGWATYGILTHQIFVILATGSSGLVFVFIACFAMRFGRSVKELKVAPFWFVVLLVSGLWIGRTGLGMLLSISVLAANLPQLWVAYKERDLSDLSLGTWSLSITDGMVWGLYAVIWHDASIMVYGIFQLATSGPIVWLKLMHRARHGKPRTGVSSQ